MSYPEARTCEEENARIRHPSLLCRGHRHLKAKRETEGQEFYPDTGSIYRKTLLQENGLACASLTGLSLIFYHAIQWKIRSGIRKIQSLPCLYYLSKVKMKLQPGDRYSKTSFFFFFDARKILEAGGEGRMSPDWEGAEKGEFPDISQVFPFGSFAWGLSLFIFTWAQITRN